MKKFSSISTFLLVISSASLFASILPRTASAAECGDPVPAAPKKVSVVSGPRGGEVTLYWETSAYANRYAVAYGTTSSKYIYGANNIGGEKARSYTVKSLTPGVRYYFKLAAARDCSSSGFSSEVSAVAAGGAVVIPVTSVTPVTPVTTVKPVTSIPSVQPVVSSGAVGKQKLTAASGPKVGEVTLRWQHADSADNYHLMYGTKPSSFQYGALNIGNVTQFTVRYLKPGTVYYFALVPLLNNQPLYTTAAVAGRAWTPPVEVVVTTKEALIEPKPVVSVPVGVGGQDLSISPPPESTSTPDTGVPVNP